MKKAFLTIAAAALVAAGCSRLPSTENYAVTIGYPLEEGTEKPDLSIDISLDYPVKGLPDSVITKMTANILAFSLDLDAEPSDVKTTVDSFVASLEDTYRSENIEFWKTDKEKLSADEAAEFYSWENNTYGYFSCRWREFLTYITEFYTYSGGAHGMQGLSPMVLSVKTGDPVTEVEIFSEGYEEALTEGLRKHLKDVFPEGSDEYESLFVKDIEPNGCFELSKKGITYYYQPYEIGAYYLGVISVTVPWKELRDFI